MRGSQGARRAVEGLVCVVGIVVVSCVKLRALLSDTFRGTYIYRHAFVEVVGVSLGSFVSLFVVWQDLCTTDVKRHP